MLRISVHLLSKRHLFVILLIACLGSYFIFGWIMKKEDVIIYSDHFVIDTPGCRIPELDPWDSSVAQLIKLQAPYECPGYPLFLTTTPNGSLIFNRTVMQMLHMIDSDVVCFYQAIRRKHEKPGSTREIHYTIEASKPLHLGVNLKEDHIKVTCTIKGSKKFEHFFPLVHLKESIEKVKPTVRHPTAPLNVILLGIDSISKLNFLRHLTKTHEFLQEKIAPLDMKGYTKVGENSFPNLIPLLTGQFYNHYWNQSKRNTMFWDEVDLLWKTYSKKGYRTFYAEDMPLFGTFQYEKRGFYDPPTDYYFRPLALAIHYSALRSKSKHLCLNSQIETEVIYNYLRDFVLAMESRPYFAFAMVSTVTHDYLNHAGYVDKPTVRLLEDLFNSGTFNKTVFIIFSDHGLRFGPIRQTLIGKFEERMPFMYVHFPKWFLKQNPQIAKNLHTNQERLITLFDVHETLVNLLDIRQGIPSTLNQSTTLGSSLMSEISENRTCYEANISPHCCPCHSYEAIPLTERRIVRSAQAIVDNINVRLQSNNKICAFLEIKNVTDAQLTHANELEMQFLKQKYNVDRYLITLIAKPGDGVFEGTVHYDSLKDSYKVIDISRLNMYGTQSECIDIHKLKIFCYCVRPKMKNNT